MKEPIKNFKEEKLEDNKDIIDEITIIYKIKKYEIKNVTKVFMERIEKLGETISENKIFGENFVKNNKNKCKMIINGKEKEISSYIDNENKNLNKEKIEIK